MGKKHRETEISRQGQSKQVWVDDMEIIGSWGSQVVIGSRNVRAIQVAGDSVTGDVYRVISRGEQESLADIRAAALQQDLPDEQKQALEQVLADIDGEIAKGKEANESWLNYLFSAVNQISPPTLTLLADWMLGHDDIPKNIQMLARNARPREGR